ncbi:MAG: aconitase X catalytic domain-containing protein [Desulfobacterales bacterium]|nr:aconitase X catalytic domain-containing protein [Desulfobacterales bacterium]
MLKLTDDEKRMLYGDTGAVKQKSMEFIVNYANALGADRLCKVTKAQLYSGNHLYLKAIREPDVDRAIAKMHFASDLPLEFNNDVACFSQFCALRTDLDQWDKLGFSKAEADENLEYLARYRKAGVSMAGTCCSYLSGFIPLMGEHYVCTESHTIIFMNSVWGACGNADGIAAAFCSAMCGRTAYWGNHVPEQRKANMLVHIDAKIDSLHDWDSLGFHLGKISPAYSIPFLKFSHGISPDMDKLRASFASMATSGGIELCHIHGLTPEARDEKQAFDGKKPKWEIRITQKDIDEVREFLCDTGSGQVDYIHLGCPHYSLEQIAKCVAILKGRTINQNVALHIWTAPAIKYLADINGYTKILEKAGANLFAGSCALVSGKMPKRVRSIAFDSAKQVNPQKSQFNGKIFYGTMERCLTAAINGFWEN